MCGRYALNAIVAELIEHFQRLCRPGFSPRFNIALTSQIPVIRYKPDTGRVTWL
jgi:putative SOS response-associated peptidase YedK